MDVPASSVCPQPTKQSTAGNRHPCQRTGSIFLCTEVLSPRRAPRELSLALGYFPIVWTMSVPPPTQHTLYVVSIVCSISIEDGTGRTWLESPLMVGLVWCRAVGQWLQEPNRALDSQAWEVMAARMSGLGRGRCGRHLCWP